MARFEVTMATGETLLVDHTAADLNQLLTELTGQPFLVLTEVKGAAVLGPPREVLLSSTHVAMVRSVDSQTRQGSSFVPKR